MRSVEENYQLSKMIVRECMKENLCDNMDLCCQCVIEGWKLWESSDLTMDKVVSQIKEKYMVFNN